jgi:hypothetical protein
VSQPLPVPQPGCVPRHREYAGHLPHGTSNESPQPAPPAHAPRDESPRVVTVTSAVRTSAGPGPGTFSLPRAEAAALVNRRLAYPGGKLPERGTRGLAN